MTTSLLVVLSAVFAYQGPPPAKAVPQPTSSEAPQPSRPAASPKRTNPPRSPSQAPPTGDQQLEKAIQARFAASKISSNGFQVRVQGGIAYLDGSTSVLQHKGTATRLAKNAGALKVVNHIQVSEEARERAVSNLSSGRRRAQLKRSDTPEKRTEVPGRN